MIIEHEGKIFSTLPQPRLFYNGSDYVVARSPIQAAAEYFDHTGEVTLDSAWVELSGDHRLSLWVMGVPGAQEVAVPDAVGAHVEEHPASYWATFGVGYLASEDL